MFDFIASLLYPKKCVGCRKAGSYICPQCFSKVSFLQYQLCAVCQKGSIDGLTHPKCKNTVKIDGIISLIAYKGIVKKLLYQFKYKPFLSVLAPILAKIMYEGLLQNEAFMKLFGAKQNLWITCVSITKKRERVRGYNQSALLAYELAVLFEKKFVSDLILRKKETQPQFELKKEQRLQNMKGAFELNSIFKNKIKGKTVIIVDDIATTGSTLRECGKVLKKSGAGIVLGVTLAHEG